MENVKDVENIDFRKVKSMLSKEDKRALAYEFISAECAMYSYDGDDHPSVILHRLTFKLFCKDNVKVDDFIEKIIEIDDARTPNQTDRINPDFDLSAYIMSKLCNMLDI
jgi:hypothetical protein